jgi:two-component system sensor histidine kinase AlgZ
VENAITHGIAMMDEPGVLEIVTRVAMNRLTIIVSNDLGAETRKHRGGVGIENVRARLFAHFGKDASLRLDHDGTRFRAELDLPATNRQDSGDLEQLPRLAP